MLMNNLLKYFFHLSVFIIPFFIGITLFASELPVAAPSQVVVRQPDAKFIDSYKSLKEFTYLQQPPLETNFFKKFIDYITKLFPALKRYSDLIPTLLKWLLWIMAIVLLFVVITKTKIYKLFYTVKAIENPEVVFSNPDDQLTDFDEAIRLQLAQQQFRQAVRLLYLKLINLLRSKDYIRYSKEKTNRDYLSDLTNHDLKAQFYTITSIYNYVWYGDAEIALDQYQRFEKSFQSFYSAINEKE